MTKPLVIMSCVAGAVLFGVVWWLASPPEIEFDQQAEICQRTVAQCSDQRDRSCKVKLRRACLNADLLPVSRVAD